MNAKYGALSEEIERLRATVAAYEKGREISGYLGGKAIEDYTEQNREIVRLRAINAELSRDLAFVTGDCNARIAITNDMHDEIEKLKAINAELVAALEKIAMQRSSADIPDDEVDDADFTGAYDTMIEEARAAIAKAKGETT